MKARGLGARRFWRMVAGALVCVLTLSVLSYGTWVVHANRTQELLRFEQRQIAWARAMQWVRVNREAMLAEPNSALWWMLRHAAEASNDGELQALVSSHLADQYPSMDGGYSPWRRLVDGHSPVAAWAMPAHVDAVMVPYQRDFLHAVTCQAGSPQGVHEPGAFLVRNLCRPNFWTVLSKDKVCATHQLMAMQAYRQTRCRDAAVNAAVVEELARDVHAQLVWLPAFEDAYIQRVLVMYWQHGGQAVRPVWLNRVLSAQRADGGWSGERWVLELPEAAQPSVLRNAVLQMVGRAPRPVRSDFHATAQAMLLLALTLKSEHQGVWALGEQWLSRGPDHGP